MRWVSNSREIRFNRWSTDDGLMSTYWETGTPPLSEIKDIWFLTENDGLIKIDADWFDDAGSGFVRWIVPTTETTVRDAMDGLETDQQCLMVVADVDSVGASPDYVRVYDHGFYLQLKIGDDPIETKWLRPASYNPGVWHWVSDWEELSSAPTVAGTAYEAAVYDIEGAGQYTADDEVTIHEDVARADQLGPTFVTYCHDGMDEAFREYQPRLIYPQDGEVELSRRNIYRPRKFVFGKVEGSSNNGLPIPNIDFRSGARGNIDYNQAELVGDDLLPLTVFRPDAGNWRIDVDMNMLTRQQLDKASIVLLRVNTDALFLLGASFVRIGRIASGTSHRNLAIDSDGDAYVVDGSGDYLRSVDLETGIGTQVGTGTGFGIGEGDPWGLTFTDNGTLYFTGRTKRRLSTLSKLAGNATYVGTTPAGFGVGEVGPTSLAAIGNDVYMTGAVNGCAYEMDTSTGAATRIGNIDNYGQPTTLGATTLFAINGRMFVYGETTDIFYELDLETGYATPLGGDTDLTLRGISAYNGAIYVVENGGFLGRSNVLDLPISISAGVGTPVISRYNFPGYYARNNYSVTAKLVSPPFYTDGTQDFTLVWNLIQRIGETVGDPASVI